MKQLVKQSNSIGTLIPKLPKYNVKIYDAYKTSKRIMDFNTNAEMNTLVELIGQWSFYLGLSEKTSEKEIILNAQFIKENYGTLNTTDIKEAIKMSATEQFDKDIEHFGKLSPLYIGKILNAYKSKRSSIIVEVNQQVAKIEAEANKKPPSKEEMLNNTKFILNDAWQTVNKKNKTYYDFGDCVYNFIKEHKLVKIDNLIIERAKEYAKKNVKQEKANSSISSVINNMPFKKVNEDSIMRKKAREYIVNIWLSSKGEKEFKEFVNNIK